MATADPGKKLHWPWSRTYACSCYENFLAIWAGEIVLQLSPPEEEKVLLRANPKLSELLNIEEILPFLLKYELMTSSDEVYEILFKEVFTRKRKIQELVEWFSHQEKKILSRFIACLRESADGTAHDELAQTLLLLSKEVNDERPIRTLLGMCKTIAYAFTHEIKEYCGQGHFYSAENFAVAQHLCTFPPYLCRRRHWLGVSHWVTPHSLSTRPGCVHPVTTHGSTGVAAVLDPSLQPSM